MSQSPKNILVAVCGGIAAYKALDVVSSLRKAGHQVQVAMTPAAQEFVAPLTFAAVSGQPVIGDLFPEDANTLEETYPHLYPATQCDIFILMPATANTIGNIARGLGSDVVSTSALSLTASCRRYFCPAMNVEMWDQPVVQDNVRAMEGLGWERIGPESGHLACGMVGAGRLSAPQDIVDLVLADDRLAGKRVLVLSGPTREHIDPVRYIGNPSSGKMGKAVAEAALREGAEVAMISGPVDTRNLPAGVDLTRVVSAEEMLAAARNEFAQADIVLYVAAVADYKPVVSYDTKAPKTLGNLNLELQATPDIAATLCAGKRDQQVCIGFALQTEDGESHAQRKLKAKSLDGIVLNYVDTLGANDGRFTFIAQDTEASDWGRLDKRACADNIIDQAIALRAAKD